MVFAIALLEMLATLATGLFTGAAIYINLVEHPARMTCGTAAALAQWAPSYKRATVMQAALAAAGFLAALVAWTFGSGIPWLYGGLLLGLVIPVTFVLILPTNRKLLSPGLPRDSPEAHQLLELWNRLHAVRSLLSLSAFVVFLIALIHTTK